MGNWFKWLISVITGGLAAFFGQYGLFIALVAVAVVLDVITGLIKAKATGEGLDSGKATKGFWKKISLFVGLAFGIFLFAHEVEHAVASVLGCHLQPSADVAGDELSGVLSGGSVGLLVLAPVE